jgi:hypothetical protein
MDAELAAPDSPPVAVVDAPGMWRLSVGGRSGLTCANRNGEENGGAPPYRRSAIYRAA